MSPARIPKVFAHGRWHSDDELDTAARCWRAAILEAAGSPLSPFAAVLPASPDGVALFAAATGVEAAPGFIGPDPETWPSALPPGISIALIPTLAHLAPEARRRGWTPMVLPNPTPLSPAPVFEPFSGPGVITFTSGSTGAPKPVFRIRDRNCTAAAARSHALGLRAGDGIIVGVTLVHGQGMNMLIAAMLLGGPLAFLPPTNHRAALATLSMPEFRCWRATPHFADVLGRCTLVEPAVAPPVCVLSSPVSRSVFDRFLDRFGVPLRQAYASSETGAVSVDGRPAAAVQPGTVGTPLPGVEISVGEQPGSPLPFGETGRLWIRTPWLMGGYGWPPDVQRPGELDGWWPTRDVGSFNESGELVLAGRLDECIRSRDGRLVNLAAVATLIREVPGVQDVAVLPIDSSSGVSFGAVLECDASVSTPSLRVRLSDALPSWARPRKLAFVPTLPRLANGKADRRACETALTD